MIQWLNIKIRIVELGHSVKWFKRNLFKGEDKEGNQPNQGFLSVCQKQAAIKRQQIQ